MDYAKLEFHNHKRNEYLYLVQDETSILFEQVISVVYDYIWDDGMPYIEVQSVFLMDAYDRPVRELLCDELDELDLSYENLADMIDDGGTYDYGSAYEDRAGSLADWAYDRMND